MFAIFYDLHIHSCLSPCADQDMTVNNIVNMAKLKGLNLIALTDHNSTKNCPAFLYAASHAGILALPGMELNTAEEVHAVCLFQTIDAAMAFDAYVYDRLPNIENKPEIFGEQLLCDASDQIVGFVPKLLITAAAISFSELDALMAEYGGFYFPSHIDRPAYSLLANLGFVPEDSAFSAFELAEFARYEKLIQEHPRLRTLPCLRNSDAHDLCDISEPENRLDGRLLPWFRAAIDKNSV